jgi:hypothetical protein
LVAGQHLVGTVDLGDCQGVAQSQPAMCRSKGARRRRRCPRQGRGILTKIDDKVSLTAAVDRLSP